MAGMADQITVEWKGPDGRTYNLSSGEHGVVLDQGQEGLHLPEVEHTYAADGLQLRSTRVKRQEISLRVLVGWDLTGAQWVQLSRRWWTRSNSPTEKGTLRVTSPDGQSLEIECRLRDTPGTTWRTDPARDITGPHSEAWLLTTTTPYWQGDVQIVEFRQDQRSRDSQSFFGSRGYAWPLYIAGESESTNLFIENTGDGLMWPAYVLQGPLVNPRFGYEGSELRYDGTISQGEGVVVFTEPGKRSAVEPSSGESRFGYLAGVFAPVPTSSRVPLVLQADGMTSESRIQVLARTQHMYPF